MARGISTAQLATLVAIAAWLALNIASQIYTIVAQ